MSSFVIPNWLQYKRSISTVKWIPWTVPGHGGDEQFLAIRREYSNSIGSSQGWEMGLEGINQQRPSLKSKHKVCVVQYWAVATCWVQRRGKVNTTVCYLFNSAVLRCVHWQQGFCNSAARVSWVLSFRLKDARHKSCSGLNKVLWATGQGRAKLPVYPNCYYRDWNKCWRERRGEWDPENKER